MPELIPSARPGTLLERRLTLIGFLILVAGLTAAAVIYLTATDVGGDVYAYDIGGGAYATAPGDSKVYRHDVELYGGKAALLADDFNRWFAGLWQGRRLAYTLAVLSIAAAAVCLLAARQLARVAAQERRIRQPEG